MQFYHYIAITIFELIKESNNVLEKVITIFLDRQKLEKEKFQLEKINFKIGKVNF